MSVHPLPSPPPHNVDAERSFLGALLADPRKLGRVPGVRLEHFHVAFHRRVFAAILCAAMRDAAWTALEVAEAVRRDGEHAPVSSADVLALANDCDGGNPEHWLGLLEDARCQRVCATAASELRAVAQQGRFLLSDAHEVLERAASGFIAAARDGDVERLGDVLGRVVRALRTRGPTGIGLGLPDLDAALGPVAPGALVVVAGRTAMGKSAFVQQVAADVARDHRVLLCSPEMSREDVARRLLTRRLGHVLDPSAQGSLVELRLDAAVTQAPPLLISDGGQLTSADVAALAHRQHLVAPLDLVVVDYLQFLADPPQRGEFEVQRLGRITRNLKTLARRLGCVVLAAAQLNRRSEQTDDHRPSLAQLRGSGDIEQDADVVLLLHRPGYYERTGDPLAEVLIAKHRFGPTCKVRLRWNPTLVCFESEGP